MKIKETLDKAYGNIPKEATPKLDIFADVHKPRTPITKWVKSLLKRKRNEQGPNV